MGRAALHRALIAANLPALLVATAVGAQDFGGRSSGNQTGLGLGIMLAQPLGEFGYYVDESMGLGTFLNLDVGDDGALGLRFDGSMVYYGSETRSQSVAIGRGYVDYEKVTIRNRIGSFFVGPQLTLASGDVRPFVHAGAGFSYFWTGMDWGDPYYEDECWDYEEDDYCDDDFADVMGSLAMFFEGDTEHSRWTTAWTAGGGFSVRLGGSLNLYFALQYVNNGRVSYLPEGAIVDEGDGYYSFAPVESDANLVFAQFGLSIQ